MKPSCKASFMRLGRRAACLLGVAVLQGCATSQIIPMTPESSAALKQAPVIQVVRYQSGGMNLMTPKSAAGVNLITAATGGNELPTGESLKHAYGLPDPAEDMARRLVDKLRREGHFANLRVEPKPRSRPLVEDGSHYRDRYRDGLVLELSIEGHGAGYGAVNWKTYTYGVYGRARLIRVSDGKVLWLDTCNQHPLANDAGKRQLDVSEFEANNGARFKEVYHYSNEHCSRVLADKILGKAS